MGLDLYHTTPSEKTEETHEYFTLEELEESSDFIEKHKHLIEEVTEANKFFEILVFPSSHIMNLYISHYPTKRDAAVLVGDLANLGNEIQKFENEHKLDPATQYILQPKDMLLSRQYDLELTYYSVNYTIGFETRRVIYWKTKGYQRKGMKPDFYKDFENCKPYFDKTSVIKASQYLGTSAIYGDDLPIHFQKNFIDNFIEGESIFFLSW